MRVARVHGVAEVISIGVGAGTVDVDRAHLQRRDWSGAGFENDAGRGGAV